MTTLDTIQTTKIDYKMRLTDYLFGMLIGQVHDRYLKEKSHKLSWSRTTPAIDSDFPRSAIRKNQYVNSIINFLIAIVFMVTADSTHCQTNTDSRIKIIEEKIAKLEEPQRRLVVVNDEIDYLYNIHYPKDADIHDGVKDRYQLIADEIVSQKTKSIESETIELPLTKKTLEANKAAIDAQISYLFDELKKSVDKAESIKNAVAGATPFIAIDSEKYENLGDDAKKKYDEQKARDDELKSTLTKITQIQNSREEKTKEREKLDSEILNVSIKLGKLTDEKNKISKKENNVSTEEKKIRIIEWIYNINLEKEKTDTSYYDRVKTIYNKMDFTNYDRERVRYGLSIGNTLDSLSLLYASINIKAYLTPHQFVPGHWDRESIFRRASIFFGVGSVISQPNSVDKTGTVYTIGLGMDVNPDFTVGIGYSIFDITQDDQTNKRNKSFSVNLLLSPAVFTRLFGGKD